MASRRTSTACVNCRSRRIKCNESKPRCAQCARAGLFCWGYIGQTELRIVSMTGKQGHQKRKQSNVNDSDSTTDDASSSSRLSRRRYEEQLLPLPRFNFPIPPESVAQVFFFRHYSIAGASKLYAVQGTAPLPTVKMLAILAVGMAGVANSERDHGVMALARVKYGLTLHSINNAIRQRGEATKESTVAAVVLMAMFEMITCPDAASLEAWVCHVQGASTLLRHWSEDDWKRTINVRAFLHIFYVLAMSCLIRRIPVPTHIFELARSSPSFKSDKDLLPAKQLFSIICKLADLHSSSGNTINVTRITEKVSTAINIEEDLLSWGSHLPHTWRYTDPDKAHGEYRRVYACSWQAYIWHQYRTCRIFVHTVLLRYLDTLALPVAQAHPALMAAYTSQKQASRHVLATMMLEIRANVSYILGLNDKTRGSHSLSSGPSAMFGLLSSMQALIGVVDISGEDADWLCEILELMGNRLGVGQALVLGKHLRERSLV